MARTSNLANVATVSRASKAWYPGGWDFTNGGAITGDLVEYANNIPRDGAQGLLVEEGSTNQIRNPRAEGSTTGDLSGAGSLPTNWTGFAASGVTVSNEGAGTESGWPYIDLRFNGTPVGNPNVHLEGATQITAADGQDWTSSVGFKIVGGDATNFSGVRLAWIERAAGASVQTQQSSTFVPDATHKRFFYSNTLSGGGTVDSIHPYIFFIWDGSGAIDITLRIYAPQLEEKAYPTSIILPPVSSPAASTRNADDIEVANGAWSNDNGAGSFYVSAAYNNDGVSGTFPRLLAYGVDVSNRLFIYRNQATGNVLASLVDGGATQASVTVTPTSVATGQTVKVAFGMAADDFSLSANGATQATDAAGSLTLGASSLFVGQSITGTGALPANAYIKEIRYWPRRLSNAELEALVGN